MLLLTMEFYYSNRKLTNTTATLLCVIGHGFIMCLVFLRICRDILLLHSSVTSVFFLIRDLVTFADQFSYFSISVTTYLTETSEKGFF